MREPFVFGFFKAVYADLKTLLEWVKARFRKE